MNFRKTQLAIATGVFFLLFLTVSAAPPAGYSTAVKHGAPAAVTAATASSATRSAANWVFEGCWTYWPAGPCRDVYRDQSGNYWICRACGTTGTPSTSKCSRISPQTLATGYWCS